MKNRVGTLYGKPVVIGDKNLVTDNEIHVSNLSNNKADGGSSDKIEYYKFNEPISVTDEMFNMAASTVAFENGQLKGIVSLKAFELGFIYHSLLGFTFIGIAMNSENVYMEFNSFIEYAKFRLSVQYPSMETMTDEEIYNFLNITPITKEEYFNLAK